jgi:hypothetical protein
MIGFEVSGADAAGAEAGAVAVDKVFPSVTRRCSLQSLQYYTTASLRQMQHRAGRQLRAMWVVFVGETPLEGRNRGEQ